jgi:2-oxo-4-hydroxy-4-carboxy--5-ureidoimidazoline (OHCU) decarboxylase
VRSILPLHCRVTTNSHCTRRYIYIVCATGKSAQEMLAILEARIGNSLDAELPIAAAEQSKISKIRLGKLLQEYVIAPRGTQRSA